MLKIRCSSDPSITVALCINLPPLGGNFNRIMQKDPVFQEIFNQSYRGCVMSDLISWNQFYLHTADTGVSDLVFSRKPFTTSNEPSAHYDDLQYGSFFDNISLFSRFLGGLTTSIPTNQVKRERFTRHRNIVGKGLSNVVGTYDYQSAWPFYKQSDHNLPIYHFPGTFSCYIDYSFNRISHAGDTGEFFDMRPFFELLQSNGISTIDAGHDIWYTEDATVTIRDVELSFSGSVMSLSYFVRFDYTRSGSSYFEQYRISLTTASAFVQDDWPYAPNQTTLRIAQQGSHHMVCSEFATNDSLSGGFDVTYGNSFVAVVSIPSYSATSSVGDQRAFISPQIDHLIDSLANEVDQSLGDITALSRTTATQAIQSLLSQSLESTLTSFGLIRDMVTLSSSISTNLDKVSSRVSLSSLGKQASGSFSVMRYRLILSDGLNLLAVLLALSKSLNSKSVPYTSHSSHSFHGTFCGMMCSIDVHSKVYILVSPLRLLECLLGPDILLVLDDILRLGPNLPIGLLIDRIAHVRDRIAELSSVQLVETAPFYFVHSYTITRLLTATELDSLGLSRTMPSPIYIKYYIRDVSSHFPIWAQSRFDDGTVSPSDLLQAGVSLVRRFVSLLV